MATDTDQIAEKCVCLVINNTKKGVQEGAKISGKALALAMRTFLATGEKAEEETKGKQSLKQLTSDGAKIENVQLCSETVKKFERCATKYDVPYTIKKATLNDKPVHLAFFKSRDKESMDLAFREYSAKILHKSQTKPTLWERFKDARQKAKDQPFEQTNKQRTQEATL